MRHRGLKNTTVNGSSRMCPSDRSLTASAGQNKGVEALKGRIELQHREELKRISGVESLLRELNVCETSVTAKGFNRRAVDVCTVAHENISCV